MRAGDLRQLTPEELEARIRELREQIFSRRVKHATGQLSDTASLRTTRRDLARALTVLRERSRSE